MPRTRIPRPIFLIIPCGADKLDHAAPARDLYCGSMFRSSLAAVQAEAADTEATILILSALHGLITLDTVLEPYNVKMGDAGSVTAQTVAAQAAALGMDWESRPDVYAFLPNRYFAVLDEALRSDDVYASQVYEACGGIGEQRGVNRIVRETEYPALDEDAA